MISTNGKADNQVELDWAHSERWAGVKRPYAADVVPRLRGTVRIAHTLAQIGCEKLWQLVNKRDYVPALGAMSGNQAVQMVQAGLEAIYLSGWQVAADANLLGQVYPDMSLYPSNSGPALCRRINQALQRADQIDCERGINRTDWFVPIVADAEAGFGGVLNTYELMREYIEAGAAAVHFEDQLSSAKKCGHMGGKVVVHTSHFVEKLVAARLAADVADVSTIIIARTDANGAKLITTDLDERDHPFIGERASDGFFRFNGGIEAAIARGVAYAPYADMVWCETARPDLEEARRFAEGIHAEHPGKLLAYNCSPSFNWKKYLDDQTIARFQRELGAMGYKFQFVTLAGFHSLNCGIFELASGYRTDGMSAYAQLQEREFELERKRGYAAVKHQQFVGTGYFDRIQEIITGGCETTALAGSTEHEQFAACEPPTSVGADVHRP